MKMCFRAQKVIEHTYVNYTCSIETVQQNGRFELIPLYTNIFSLLKTVFGYLKKKISTLTNIFPKDGFLLIICSILK